MSFSPPLFRQSSGPKVEKVAKRGGNEIVQGKMRKGKGALSSSAAKRGEREKAKGNFLSLQKSVCQKKIGGTKIYSPFFALKANPREKKI